jgi:hypothetical protein
MALTIVHRHLAKGFFPSLVVAIIAGAEVRDPFPPGFAMGTMGSVIDEARASGSEPWASASLCGDSTGYGAAMSGVAYYGSAANPAGTDGICRATGGGWLCGHKLICKASVSYFRALDAYYEQSGFLSLGTSALHFTRLSVEATVSRFGVHLPGNPSHSTGRLGVSAWIPCTWAAVSLRVEHIALATAHADGADPPLTLRCGFHTTHNRFGGQGVLVTITPGEAEPVCFTIGEEYRFGRAVAFQAALANNPLLIGAGLVFSLRRLEFSAALVNHPVLGWSQGFSAEYRKGSVKGEE